MGLSDIFMYSGSTPLPLILWSFYIAIVISTVYMYVTKVKFGKLVYALMEKEAFSPNKALTLDELGLKPSFFIKIGLKNHLNYKNLLVAITEDGRYYANTLYTDDAPEFKNLVAITRKKRSRITENKNDNEAELNNTEEPLADTSEDQNVVSEQNSDVEITEKKPERVKFDIFTAKYYIPSAILPKVRTMYNDRSVKLWWIIGILIGLGIIIYFAGFVTEELVDMVANLGKD